jgi:hypothetical protein
MAASPWTETIGMIMKLRLEDRIQQAPEHFLRNPIPD